VQEAFESPSDIIFTTAKGEKIMATDIFMGFK
jgi:hypothetical protein